MSRSSAKLFVVFFFFILALTFAPARGVVNGTVIPCEDRRFDAVGLFITGGFYSCGGYISGSCVLIAPDTVVLARHELDVSSISPLPNPQTSTYRVRFRRALNGDAANTYFYNGDSCSGVYQEIRVIQFIDSPSLGMDMVVAKLERRVTGIRPIGLDLTTLPRAGTSVIMAGWGYDGTCYQSGTPFTLRYARGNLPYTTTSALDVSLNYTPCTGIASAACLSCPAVANGISGPWLVANLHDSGGGVFTEVATVVNGVTFKELRMIGMVLSTSNARRLNAWNQSGAAYQLQNAAALTARNVADFNIDGAISTEDLFDFIQAFFGGKCTADIDLNGSVTTDDVYKYLSRFLAP